MTYDYFYGQQAEMFAFYRVPKVLFTEDCFWNVSTDAKLLYGILLDRMNLSARNGWLDEEGRVYIIFTIEEIKGALGCAEKKAVKLLDELEKKCGLIERKRQGLGKPNLIYVKNFISGSVERHVFSTTVFAYSDESATTTTTEKAETVETVPEKTEDKTSEELPYTVTVNEDGTVVFSFNGKEWIYDAEESEDNNMGTGKVVTSGSRLNVRTGAGMNYEIIDQLRPGEEVVVVGVEGDWYQITVPEKNGYVHSDYLELIEKAEQNSEMDMALLMYYDQKESGKRIAKLRKKKGLTQEQLAEKLSISYSLLAKVESGSRAASIDLLVEMKAFFDTTLDYLALGIEPMTEPSKHEDLVYKNQAEQKIAELEQKFKELKEIIL